MRSENVEEGLTLLGLLAIMDPPGRRPKEAIAVCKTAESSCDDNSDHPLRQGIAKSLHINEDSRTIITGRELERLLGGIERKG